MKFFYWLILSFLILVSCSEEDKDFQFDTTPPTISVITPVNFASYPLKGILQLNLKFYDDRELSQCKIIIHNDDGHTHKKSPFQWDTVFQLGGRDYTITQAFSFPENTSTGPYHLLIYCTDIAGNEAELVQRSFSIVHESEPDINNFRINGTQEDTLMMKFNSDQVEFHAVANFYDENALDLIRAVVVDEPTFNKTSEDIDPLFIWEKTGFTVNDTALFLDETFKLPSYLFDNQQGIYQIKLQAIDKNGNAAQALKTIIASE